jgi:mRNA-degrading endonuclease RelE of RelBE toxin-antitoxin system
LLNKTALDMRVHLSQNVLRLWYQLGEEGAALRSALEGLKKHPFPESVRKVEGHESLYEFFVAGYWIVYEVNQVGGETVIVVSAIEEN